MIAHNLYLKNSNTYTFMQILPQCPYLREILRELHLLLQLKLLSESQLKMYTFEF